MKEQILQKALSIKSKTFSIAFAALSLIIISSAVYELIQSRNEMYELMEKQSHSLLESIIVTTQNALMTTQQIENNITERLLNNANFIRDLYERGLINNAFLSRFANSNKIFRINIFNKKGIKIYTSQREIHDDLEENNSPSDILNPIFTDLTDTLIIGIKKARYLEGYRFSVAVSAKNRSAIVVNIDAGEFLNIRKRLGFGVLLGKIAEAQSIEYIAVQDTNGILAASGNVTDLESIFDSHELLLSFKDSLFISRISDFDSLEVFETVHPFSINNKIIGIIRIGMTLDPLNSINDRLTRRIIIIALILLILGAILMSFLMARKKLADLSHQYQAIESYSNSVLENVEDAIIVLDEKNNLQKFNSAAARLLGIKSEQGGTIDIKSIINQNDIFDFLDSESQMREIECPINNSQKHLLLSKSEFTDENGLLNLILVIHDLTSKKFLEKQVEINNRLTAMGELASGVAHEIRNPLNTISTISQQLERDFKPTDNYDEYLSLSKLVQKEIKRINKTIENFLRFARPEKIYPANFYLKDFLKSLQKQYGEMLSQKNISITIDNCDIEVHWDYDQMRQVFMNLMQNSYDAVSKGGKISINIIKSNNELRILFNDDGKGIPEHLLDKVFNLYFTTKAEGTGIGLSIIQRIINAHGGSVIIKSSVNKGTTFSIILPIFYFNN